MSKFEPSDQPRNDPIGQHWPCPACKHKQAVSGRQTQVECSYITIRADKIGCVNNSIIFEPDTSKYTLQDDINYTGASWPATVSKTIMKAINIYGDLANLGLFSASTNVLRRLV